MRNFGLMVDQVIDKSDIVLEILDARFIEETRNKSIEQKVKHKNKILVHVINKCDFVDKNYLDNVKKGLENCVFVSAKNHLGTTLLKQKIKMLAKRMKYPVVGVVGYPNVGKSSVINALKGRNSAKVSPEPGFTKAKQCLNIDNDFYIIDTPGVIPKDNKEELVLIGAQNYSTIKDPDLAVMNLMVAHPGLIEKRYGIKPNQDKESAIEEIALKLKMKKKGNLLDVERTSRKILREWIES